MVRYKKLRGRMYENDVKSYEIAKAIGGKSLRYTSSRMTGKYPWSMDDVYAICELLAIPLSEIPEYFPKGGQAHA